MHLPWGQPGLHARRMHRHMRRLAAWHRGLVQDLCGELSHQVARAQQGHKRLAGGEAGEPWGQGAGGVQEGMGGAREEGVWEGCGRGVGGAWEGRGRGLEGDMEAV